MAKTKKAEAVVESMTEEMAAALEAPVDDSPFLSAQELLDAEPPEGMNDPGWSDFVLSKFAHDELGDGKPKVNGLRRVAQLLLGPIVMSYAKVVQSPRYIPLDEGNKQGPMWEPAVVEYAIQILWKRTDEREGLEVEYQDCATLWSGNCDNPDIARFMVEVAATRAEARALRKLLALKGIAYEESVSPSETTAPSSISPAQVLFLEAKARELDIDLKAFVNAGQRAYRRIDEVPRDTALVMADKMGEYVRAPQTIPAKMKGFKADWRRGFGG